MSNSDEPAPSSTASAPASNSEHEEAGRGDEEREPSDGLQHNLPLSQHAERDAYAGPVTIGVVKNEFGDGESRTVVTWWPLRDEFAAPPPSFVDPPHFGALLQLVREQHLALLVGGGCGNVTVAGAVLRAAGHAAIVELPASPTAHELLAAIKQVCSSSPDVGIIVPSIGEEIMCGFGATELRRLRGSLGPKAAVVFTTRVRSEAPSPDHALPTVEAAVPDPIAIVEAHAPAEPQVRERAARALSILSPEGPVGPGAAVALVDAARANEDASGEQLAKVISGRSDALDEWLAGRPTAEHVASLAAAVALDGVASADVDAEAARLRTLLEGELEPADEPKRFGLADRGWPTGVVALSRKPVGTYFGVQDAEVVEICPPHRREILVTQLWDRLGPEFREAFITWLQGLAEHPSPRLRSGAAVSAGILFAKEPMTIERELLRPWALDGRRSLCECVGLALGVPALLGADPGPSRALTYVWSERRSGQNRQRAAIAAYGGPLGAWDIGSGAPAQLWRIPEEHGVIDRDDATGDSQLQRAADISLAALTASGAEARQVRATVISLLATQTDEQHSRARAYGLLPLILRRLTRGDELARESFAALLQDDERPAFEELTILLARAFDAPAGFASARAAVLILLDSIGTGRIAQDVVNQIVRGAEANARPGRRAALGQQLERVFAVERRRETPRGRAASAVYTTFFSTPQEVY